MAFRRLSKKKIALGQAVLDHINSPEKAASLVNKKIKSATKEVKYGITFDSRLELYMYEQLCEARIPFNFKPKYTIQEGFRYRGDAVLPITLTPDFELYKHDIIIDAKGFANDTAPLKMKMLKNYLISHGRQPRIILPNSQVKCREIIYRIKNGFFIDPHDPKQQLSAAQLKERIKRLKVYFTFDGKAFSNLFWQDEILLDDIKILEKWDFELLMQNLSSRMQ